MQWLRSGELAPYRPLVTRYRTTSEVPQEHLDALAGLLDHDAPIRPATSAENGYRQAREKRLLRSTLTRWWSPESQAKGATARRRPHQATGNVREILVKVWWELVAVSACVQEQARRFTRGKVEHYTYIRSILRMRQGTTSVSGAAIRLLSLRWSELAGRLAVPITNEARSILARKREAEREAVEERQREAAAKAEARKGKRSLVRVITTTLKWTRSGFSRPVGTEEMVYDLETGELVRDASEAELAAAKIERKTRDIHPAEKDEQRVSHAVMARYRESRWT